jgi:putative two-component system response regulator
MKQEKIFETVGDVFDALISERPYKKEWPVEKAVQELKDNSGIHFDPVLGFD